LKKASYKIGVISDTHGLLRSKVEEQLGKSDIIIHAGDIGCIEIIDSLRQIAPVYAVRGNVDKEKWADEFPEIFDLEIFNKKIFVIHNIRDVNINSENSHDIVISGHSHKPLIKEANGTIFINPGSAGKRRFNLPVSIGQISIVGDNLSAKIIELEI
jgi:uncharacterized protein